MLPIKMRCCRNRPTRGWSSLGEGWAVDLMLCLWMLFLCLTVLWVMGELLIKCCVYECCFCVSQSCGWWLSCWFNAVFVNVVSVCHSHVGDGWGVDLMLCLWLCFCVSQSCGWWLSCWSSPMTVTRWHVTWRASVLSSTAVDLSPRLCLWLMNTPSWWVDTLIILKHSENNCFLMLHLLSQRFHRSSVKHTVHIYT